MTKIPDSLRKILEKQKPAKFTPPPLELEVNDKTLIFRDGEILKKSPGRKWRELRAIDPIP